MSSLFVENLNIGTLPHDVIRNIIHVGHESIDSMRLASLCLYKCVLFGIIFKDNHSLHYSTYSLIQISRIWDALAIEHLSNPRYRPVIKYFKWEIQRFGPSVANSRSAVMRVQGRYEDYFGLKKWIRSRCFADGVSLHFFQKGFESSRKRVV